MAAAFVLSGGRAHAAVQVQLSPSSNAPQPVGTTITWTASATDTNPGDLTYQFSVRLSGGDYAVARDFASSNSFEWTPSEREGTFDVRVVVKNTSTGEEAPLAVSYAVSSRVTGSSPVITSTANPLVALYSAPACAAGSMRVRFWRTGDFSSQTTPWKSCLPGVSRNFYVAGMLAATQYSMRHEVSSDPAAAVTAGPTLTFLTGTPTVDSFPATNVLIAPEGERAQDVLLHSYLSGRPLTATNLSGQLLWYYGRAVFYATRPVEGGTILLLPGSETLREIDLAGNTLMETNIKAVSDQLLAVGAAAITSFHHEARRLPDGRTLVLAGTERVMSDVQGPGPVTIVGDMIVVLDENLRVTWWWDSFDHLDVTRKALQDQKCPALCVTTAPSANDWLHSNAVGYSPADGNLLLSIRHQDWVVKIDYRDGAGTGAVLWRLGKDGDFTYESDDPYPWFSHQHDAEFELGGNQVITIFDNGNLRRLSPGAATGNSRGQVLLIDEAARKVSFQSNVDLGVYASALGSAQRLTDGSYHFLAGNVSGSNAQSIEVRPDGALSYNLRSLSLAYRSFRMRDLYSPGTHGLDGRGEAQTISFDEIGAKTFGDAPFNVNATASSDLPVELRVVSGPATLAGDTVTITGAGTVVVQADQYGNIRYDAAQSVRRSFTVDKANQTITFGTLTDKTFGDASFTPTATASSGLTVSFVATGQCTFTGGKVNITAAGLCTVTASQTGDANFDAATAVQQSFTINKAGSTTTLTFEAGPYVYRGTAFAATATVTGPGGLSAPVTVVYSGDCTNVTAADGCTATATYAATANHLGSNDGESITITKATATVSLGGLTQTYNGTPRAATATTNPAGLGVVTVTYNGSTTAPTGAGSYAVVASLSNQNYQSDGANGALTINKAAPVVSATGKTCTYNGAACAGSGSATGVDGSALGAVTLAYTPGGSAPTNAGSYTVVASIGETANHTAGSSAPANITIDKATPTVTWNNPSDIVYGTPLGATQLNAAASVPGVFSYSPAAGTVLNAGSGQTLRVNFTPTDAVNYTQVSKEVSVNVSKAATTTSLASSANPSRAGQEITFTATVTSGPGTPGGHVQFKVNGQSVGAPVPLNAGGLASFTTAALAAGSYTVTADYGGAADFNASSDTLSVAQLVGGIFEFSLPLYTVAERAGSVTFSVRRTGDVGTAASVRYATDDGSIPSVLVPCSSVTGLALGRCDYTGAAGRLDFAAGEAEKSLVVLVNDDSFVEGLETTHLRLSDASGGTVLGPLASTVLEITDDQTESTGNPLDDDEAFVRQHYHDFLGREPDAEGLKFWADGIKACGNDVGCREVKRVHTSAAFFLSIEFQNTGVFAYLMHKAASGDIPGGPTPFTFQDFTADRHALGREVVVGRPGWEQQLAANKAAYALLFVQSPEFLARYPAQTGAAAFVDMLNANAGGALTNEERSSLVSELSQDPAAASLRASVLRKVAENAQFAEAERERAFVLMEYFGYLRRNPNDAPDSDFAGYNFWLGKLNEFGGDFVRAEMVKAFISSDEYRKRFGQ